MAPSNVLEQGVDSLVQAVGACGFSAEQNPTRPGFRCTASLRYHPMRPFLLIAFLLPLLLPAQSTVIQWAYGAFGTPGDAAFVVERGRIHQAAGPFGQKGACIYVFNDNEVYHSADAFGSKGQGAFKAEGDLMGSGRIDLYRCQGTFCSKSGCALVIEGNKVFRADGPFCNKGDGAFVIEGNTIFLAEGPFAHKTDAILHVSGTVPMVSLLAILAGL